MHKDFKYGVARSKAAANRQYRTGALPPRATRGLQREQRERRRQRRHRLRGHSLMPLVGRRSLRLGKQSRLNARSTQDPMINSDRRANAEAVRAEVGKRSEPNSMSPAIVRMEAER